MNHRANRVAWQGDNIDEILEFPGVMGCQTKSPLHNKLIVCLISTTIELNISDELIINSDGETVVKGWAGKNG